MASSRYMKGYTSKLSIKVCAIVAVVALSALSFGGSPAHASGSSKVGVSPDPKVFSHTTHLVANPAYPSGIYKFCDGSNLVYELVSSSSFGEAGAMQVQFDSPQCQMAAAVVKSAAPVAPKTTSPTPTRKPKK